MRRSFWDQNIDASERENIYTPLAFICWISFIQSVFVYKTLFVETLVIMRTYAIDATYVSGVCQIRDWGYYEQMSKRWRSRSTYCQRSKHIRYEREISIESNSLCAWKHILHRLFSSIQLGPPCKIRFDWQQHWDFDLAKSYANFAQEKEKKRMWMQEFEKWWDAWFLEYVGYIEEMWQAPKKTSDGLCISRGKDTSPGYCYEN